MLGRQRFTSLFQGLTPPPESSGLILLGLVALAIWAAVIIAVVAAFGPFQ